MRLYLGCGSSPRGGWVNLDSRQLPGVDVVRDILRGIPFSDETFDEVASENFLEHIPQIEVIWVMNEIWRVTRSEGIGRHGIPRAGSTNFLQDPTHLSHWIEDTFTYFEKGHRRNIYYDGLIKPWSKIAVEFRESDSVLLVEMTK